jgi:oligopeptide/dipeptide ABC transporter ATP-binding protein
MRPLLEVDNLHVDYSDSCGNLSSALEGVHLHLAAGEIAGVLGESGSGKSTLALAILRLLPSSAHVRTGTVSVEGEDLLKLSERELESIRGAKIALIFQEPSIALHPTMRVGEQVAQVISAHERCDRRTLRERALSALHEVFSSDVERIFFSYQHQLSGGQRQRVLIAQAIACQPRILIADEPTSSLDPATQAEILTLFSNLRRRLGIAIVLITHNPAILAGLADRVIVFYAGKVVEEGSAQDLLHSPKHPYLRGLLQCMPPPPEIGLLTRKQRLPTIPGTAAGLGEVRRGCGFEPRCSDRMQRCVESDPAAIAVGRFASVSCFKYGE